MTQLIAIQSLGRNRDTSRLWIESQRLSSLGFPPCTPLLVEQRTDCLTLRAGVLAENHLSSRAAAGGRRPIIDLENQSLLSGLAGYSEVKIIASLGRIQVTPSIRAFAIQRRRTLHPPLRVLEAFAVGGTMTAGLCGVSRFKVIAGIEVEPNFADEWQAHHQDAALYQRGHPIPAYLRIARIRSADWRHSLHQPFKLGTRQEISRW